MYTKEDAKQSIISHFLKMWYFLCVFSCKMWPNNFWLVFSQNLFKTLVMTFEKIHFYIPLNLNRNINKFYAFMNQNKFINLSKRGKFWFEDSFKFNKKNDVDLIHGHLNRCTETCLGKKQIYLWHGNGWVLCILNNPHIFFLTWNLEAMLIIAFLSYYKHMQVQLN